jgi:reverse gyrase
VSFAEPWRLLFRPSLRRSAPLLVFLFYATLMSTSNLLTPLKINWTDDKLRALVLRDLKKRPCLLQMQIARAVHSKKDVIGIAPTGAGKSLTMYMPFFMAREEGMKDGLVIIASPLNNLAAQVVQDITDAGVDGLRALAVNQDNDHAATYEVRCCSFAAIIC